MESRWAIAIAHCCTKKRRLLWKVDYSKCTPFGTYSTCVDTAHRAKHSRGSQLLVALLSQTHLPKVISRAIFVWGLVQHCKKIPVLEMKTNLYWAFASPKQAWRKNRHAVRSEMNRILPKIGLALLEVTQNNRADTWIGEAGLFPACVLLNQACAYLICKLDILSLWNRRNRTI